MTSPIRSNPHTHSNFCDGRATLEEMIHAALSRDFVSLGFSSHGPQPIEPAFSLQDLPGYLAEVRRVQAQYQDQIRIHCGLELDLQGQIHRPDLDFLIGAVHYVPCGNQHFSADGPMAQLDQAYEEHFQKDGLAMAKSYYDAVVHCVQTHRPEILAHFDLLRKHNDATMRYFDTHSPSYRALAQAALESIAPLNPLLEINTGGMARGYLDTPYPDLFILQHWRSLGGQVILGSDCHSPEAMDYGFDVALELAREAGYREVMRLGGRGQGLVECVSILRG